MVKLPSPEERIHKIFVSYRRDDTSGYALALYHELSRRFGRGKVFWDHCSLKGGENYELALEGAASHCRVMLVVIGKSWAGMASRLFEDRDLVARELKSALDS